jgi:5'-deoxynucleotidase YfbR-like HD superfamily hydrolase
MLHRIASLEGDLAKSNSNAHGESERNGHMRKMFHLLESEKNILAGHLQDLQSELKGKDDDSERALKRIDELERIVQEREEQVRQSTEGITRMNNRYAHC